MTGNNSLLDTCSQYTALVVFNMGILVLALLSLFIYLSLLVDMYTKKKFFKSPTEPDVYLV